MRLLIPALLALTFVGCSCQRQAEADAPAADTATMPATDDAAARARVDAAKRADAQNQQRLDAMNEAVNKLHLYLQQLSSGKREEADKHWAYERTPRGNEEADLRSIKQFTAMRIENDTPKQLDKEAMPESLEIPVELRVSVADGESRRYTGWYRMRRNPIDRSWELTATSLSVKLQ
ncbi:putative lipoprotein [Lysobacter antibioticus]|uniref:hypothetical protein n=1 Tax=Lysobacter antibioticus TaxID=84531 RepID=UPI000717326F|nr:hypothetical protein [Lysobacter antibioticus]ALN61525.1 putative lipoprotein [Lysobacter antibioticus]